MKNPIKYLVNAANMCYLKVRYNRKLSIGIIQTFEKIRLELTGTAKAKIGRYNQNRGSLYIGVNNGTLILGNHCFFNINCSITCLEKIVIGDNCKFGNNLVIVDHDHNFRSKEPEFITKPIIIGNNVWVGANVTILRGAEIGDSCVIAAGSVVKGKIEPNTIYLNKQKPTLYLIEN